MKNHVFLFQIHKEPKLVARILKRLEAENHYFIVNIDKKCENSDEFKKELEGIGNVIYNRPVNVQRTGFSQIKCTIEQMKLAVEHKVHFDYLHTLSGQDYPCVTTEKFDAFFEDNNRSYMMLDTIDEVEEWRKNKYSIRLEHWYFWDVFNGKLAIKLHLAGIFYRLFYAFPRKCSFINEVWGGWNWFSLHRDVVDYLLKYFEENPGYVRRFHYSRCGDELIFPTVLVKKADELNIATRNSLRFVEWHPQREYKGKTPLLLNECEFEQIMQSGAFFCRKVETVESEKLLDLIDKRVFKTAKE